MFKNLLLGLGGLVLSATVQAQIIDSTFGTNGFVNTSYSAAYDANVSVVVQPDGKIVTGGVASISGKEHFVLARYDTSGMLDASFGTGGKVVMPNNSVDNRLKKIILQPDGKILAVGVEMTGSFSPWATLLARFTANGILDNSFGNAGKVITPVGAKADAVFAMLQPDGKILVCGTEYANSYFIVIRYTATGSPDNSFGTAGIAMGNDFGTGTAMALQPDGKILICGEFWGTTTLGGPHVGVARLNTNGTFDNSFGTNGSVIILSPYADNLWGAHDIKVQADGKILIPLFLQSTSIAHQPAIVRLSSTGVVDGTWGMNGYAYTQYNNFYEKGEQMAIQSDGKVLLAGYAAPQSTNDKDSILVMRFGTNGMPDATFGNNGRLTTKTSADGNAGNSIALLSDGRFYVAGYTGTSASARKSMLVRYKYKTTVVPNPSSVAQVSKEPLFSIYPNPAADKLNILSAVNNADITVTDMTGRVVMRDKLKADKSIDISMLPTGSYILQLQTAGYTATQIFTCK